MMCVWCSEPLFGLAVWGGTGPLGDPPRRSGPSRAARTKCCPGQHSADTTTTGPAVLGKEPPTGLTGPPELPERPRRAGAGDEHSTADTRPLGAVVPARGPARKRQSWRSESSSRGQVRRQMACVMLVSPASQGPCLRPEPARMPGCEANATRPAATQPVGGCTDGPVPCCRAIVACLPAVAAGSQAAPPLRAADLRRWTRAPASSSTRFRRCCCS